MSPQRVSADAQWFPVVVSVPLVLAYERVVTRRSVTLTCACCGQTVTQERMPGPLLWYCSARCRVDYCWRNEFVSSGYSLLWSERSFFDIRKIYSDFFRGGYNFSDKADEPSFTLFIGRAHHLCCTCLDALFQKHLGTSST